MGQNQAKKEDRDNKFELEVNKDLSDDIKEEIKPLNKNISSLKKGTKLMKFSGKGKTKNVDSFNNSEDEESEKEENEICLSYITELVDTIYSKNINMQLKNRPNRTVYESMFDIRNILNTAEDLNNDEYNIKSCQIMNEIIEPDVSDIINNKKEEMKNNNNKDNTKDIKDENENIKAKEEEEEKSDEEKSESIENDFFKNWDYTNDDIFINNNNEMNEIELNLDFYNTDKPKSKDKLKKNNKKLTEEEKIKRSKTSENKLKKNKSIIKKNKSLILLEDIITYNKKNDIYEIYNHINDNINNYVNKLVSNNIKNKNNSDNNIKIIENNNDTNKNINKENNNKENISINSNLPNENFEIINNEDLDNESFKKNINNKNNNDYSDENSSEFILKDKRNISNYGKDDDNKDEDDEDKSDSYINKMEKKIDKKIINLTNGNYTQENNKYDADSFNNDEIKKNSKIILNNNNSKIIHNINKNTNNKLLYKKRIINSKNNSKTNSNFFMKEKSYISKNDKFQKDIIDFNNISAINNEDNIFSSNNSNFDINEIHSPKRERNKTPLIHIPKKKNITKKNIIINNKNTINNEELRLRPTVFNQSELLIR